MGGNVNEGSHGGFKGQHVSKDWDLIKGFIMQVLGGRAKAKALRSAGIGHVQGAARRPV